MHLGYAILHQRRVPIIVEQPGLDAGVCLASHSPWPGSEQDVSAPRPSPDQSHMGRGQPLPEMIPPMVSQ